MPDYARTTPVVTVSSGELISQDIEMSGARRVSVGLPTITSGTMMLQVGIVSGTYFGRLMDPTSQMAWTKQVAAGSLSLALPDHPFPHAAVEFQNSQAAVRSLQLVMTS